MKTISINFLEAFFTILYEEKKILEIKIHGC